MTKECALERSTQLGKLLQVERQSVVAFILALVDFDSQEGWKALGYTSLWGYLSRELRMSDAMVATRVAAAQLARRYPQVGDLLREGKLCVTAMPRLATILTDANCADVLAEAIGKSKRDIDRLVATIAPQPERREVVQKLELRTFAVEKSRISEAPPRLAPTAKAFSAELVSATRFRIHLDVPEEFMTLLEQARDALSHTSPSGGKVEVLMEGLRRIVRDRDRRMGLVEKPRATPKERAPKPPWKREAPSAQTKRIVWKRVQGRCQAQLALGGICGSTRKLEFHHLLELARGGPTTAENLSLRCKAHNLLAAQETFGRDFMTRFTEPALPT
jgi:hypothetical protein